MAVICFLIREPEHVRMYGPEAENRIDIRAMCLVGVISGLSQFSLSRLFDPIRHHNRVFVGNNERVRRARSDRGPLLDLDDRVFPDRIDFCPPVAKLNCRGNS